MITGPGFLPMLSIVRNRDSTRDAFPDCPLELALVIRNDFGNAQMIVKCAQPSEFSALHSMTPDYGQFDESYEAIDQKSKNSRYNQQSVHFGRVKVLLSREKQRT